MTIFQFPYMNNEFWVYLQLSKRRFRTVFHFLVEILKVSMIFVWQTFLAAINQVFPAEEDSKKDVEDNCKYCTVT